MNSVRGPGKALDSIGWVRTYQIVSGVVARAVARVAVKERGVHCFYWVVNTWPSSVVFLAPGSRLVIVNASVVVF